VSRLRVAIGPAEIAGTSTALAEGLHALGVDAELALWSPLPGPFASDHTYGRTGRAIYALRAPLRRDVLHFQYGVTWIPKHPDAHWARILRRLLLSSYYGDDCRRWDVATRLAWPLAPFKDRRQDGAVLERLERLARLCRGAIASDVEVASYLVGVFERVYVAPVPLHNFAPPPREPVRAASLRVLHAPTDRAVKGTPAVELAAREAAKHVPLELVLLTGVGHGAVRRELARADIVVDQMHSASASVFALEGMRAGLPVLTHIDARALAPFHAELPVVPVTAESLADDLVALAGDASRRFDLGEAGRAYVDRWHSAPRAAEAVLQVYEHAREATAGVFVATPDGISPLDAEVLAEIRR
jgi:hypothetical protein